jgi:hypothetical protein
MTCTTLRMYICVYTSCQSPHFECGDFPLEFLGEVVLTEPGAQRTYGGTCLHDGRFCIICIRILS